MKNNTLVPKRQRLIFGLTLAAMALSGFGQMPIFKRYYIADVPGLGWTADYWFTHKLHYAGAIVLLFFIGLWIARYLKDWSRNRSLNTLGAIKVALYAGVIFTGAMRVVKNLDFWHWGPMTTMLADWLHLGFVILLGLAGLAGLFMGKREYLKRQTRIKSSDSAAGQSYSKAVENH